jgi:hypothetical protein
MHRTFIVATLLASTSPLAACDAPADCPAGVELREQGPPSAAYITSWFGEPIHASEFADAVIACADVEDPAWLLTLSAYQPEAGQPERVVGLGGSAFVGEAFWACLNKHWLANGAIEI